MRLRSRWRGRCETQPWTGEEGFAFGEWETPFANEYVTIYEVAYSPVLSDPDLDIREMPESMLRQRPRHQLTIRISIGKTGQIYRILFEETSAFRVLDEHGLTELWQETSGKGSRPAYTTFRIRNHAWMRESMASFLVADGWSYVIATDFDCVEIVSGKPPVIWLESCGVPNESGGEGLKVAAERGEALPPSVTS